MGFKTGFVRAAVVAAAFGVMTVAAQATTVTCNVINFTTSTACYSPVPGTGGPGPGGGNVVAADMNGVLPSGAFGQTGWKLIDDIEGTLLPGPQVSDDGFFTFTYDSNLKQGTWKLNFPWIWGEGVFAFVIKGATDNAAYLMDKNFTSGTWTVVDLDTPNGRGDPDLSNVRLFGTSDLVPIPLPAAGWMLLAGIGGLAAMRRRRKAA